MDNNEFGKLVQAYRRQRGWTQAELAERWGHTSGYVSQIERGIRKLDSASQVVRLADILDIPQEKLEAIGRGIPQRKIQVQSPAQADSAILQMLLAPGKDMVRLAWLAWYADSAPSIEENLLYLRNNLDFALTTYRGEFISHTQQLLSYIHQMLGKIAQDRLDYTAAGAHFSEMVDLGHELNDADIITTGMTHQGDVLRKRGRYESSLRCFEAAQPFAAISTQGVQGRHLMIMARAYSVQGNEVKFRAASDGAIVISSDIKDTLDNLANEFSLVDALQEQAQGFTTLWKPEKALEIYKETDRLRPPRARLLRDKSSYAIVKAQAYAYLGDLDKGLKYSLDGLQLASQCRSKRYVERLETMYNRLRVTKMSEDQRIKEIGAALQDKQKEKASW
jgi:transcriptional regulator with XRE-family HTH domain